MEIIYQEITKETLSLKLFIDFNRYQVVKKSWLTENGKRVLKDTPYTETWTKAEKARLILYLENTLKTGGSIFGAFQGGKLIGFASLESKFFGLNQDYLQLSAIHTSYEYRGQKVGKNLFKLIAQKASQMGAKKLYISTHPAEETQAFYRSLGCRKAQETREDIIKLNPNDPQLEYQL